MKIFHNIIIVGAGPIGLYFASKCEKAEMDYLVLEATGEVGGQITHLYPEKEVVDLPNIESIKAKDYISLLSKEVNLKNIVFNQKVVSIIDDNKITLETKDSSYECNKLILATGLGATVPRPLGVEHENEVDNIIYNLTDYSFLKNKRIAIFGGGDSALDWAKQLSSLSKDVHLIHRRLEFRGNPETIKGCKDLKIHLPFVPEKIDVSNKKATSITIKNVESNELIKIDVDYVFVNFGNIAEQSSFNFSMTGAFLNVDENYKVSNNIFAIGDVANYENKKRRMAPGNLEADRVFNIIND